MRIVNRPGGLYPERSAPVGRTAGGRPAKYGTSAGEAERTEGVIREPSPQIAALLQRLQAGDPIRRDRVEEVAARLASGQYDGPLAARATAEAIVRGSQP